MGVKDLLAMDPAELAQQSMDALDELGNEDGGKETPSAQATPEAKPDGQPPAETPPEQATPEEPKPEGVATKDGKGVIPFSVLEGSRKRALELEEQAAKLAQSNEELQRQLAAAAQQSSEEAGVSSMSALSEQIAKMRENLAEIEEDLPVQAEILRGTLVALETMRDELVRTQNERKEREEADRQREADKQRQSVQDAIDSVPALVHWQTNDPATWELAISMDNVLSGQSQWQGKPLVDRFTAVANAVIALNPDVSLPAAKSPPPAAPAAPGTPAPVDTRPQVLSLSDIPGGTPPAGSQVEQLGDLSTAALQNRFSRMTREQLEKELSAFG